MIRFKTWKLSGELDVQQLDHMSVAFRVYNLPKGYTWKLLWSFGENLNVLDLTLDDSGDVGEYTFRKEDLAFEGVYVAQLRATSPNGAEKHTDKLEINVAGSFGENSFWPKVPDSFDKYVSEVADNLKQQINVDIKEETEKALTEAKNSGEFTPTIKVGTVTTLPPDEKATAEITGKDPAT
ncbi:MAG: hypothetical protein IKY59_06500, partial [Oscillospiraceae bacterium]|nr:hypothetical protein [Oscillospiraceae bacterium]